MRITVESRDVNKTVMLKGKTVKELMRQIRLSPENFVVSRNGAIVLGNEMLKDKDRIKLFPVVSGG